MATPNSGVATLTISIKLIMMLKYFCAYLVVLGILLIHCFYQFKVYHVSSFFQNRWYIWQHCFKEHNFPKLIFTFLIKPMSHLNMTWPMLKLKRYHDGFCTLQSWYIFKLWKRWKTPLFQINGITHPDTHWSILWIQCNIQVSTFLWLIKNL
jgi:hypothetical protein